MRSNKIIIFTLSLYICFQFLVFSYPQLASAAETTLKISPSNLQIKAVLPADINAPILIENPSDQPLELEIELRLFKPSSKENGQIELLPRNSISNSLSNVTILDQDQQISSLTLSPRQTKTLTLRIILDKNELVRDQYFSIIFKSLPKSIPTALNSPDSRSMSTVNIGVGMNVLISLIDPEAPDGSKIQSVAIESFTSPQNIQKGPIDFTIKLKNNSSKYINPNGTITIKNMYGQTVGKLDIPEKTILASSSRLLNVSWPEKFLLGFYTAEISASSSQGSQPATQVIYFTALPLKLIITIIATITLFFIIRKRVKTKMLQR